MPPVVNKLKGTLQLGDVTTGTAVEAQVTDVGIVQTVTRDSPITTLDGSVVHSPATYSYELTGSILLDLTVGTGGVYTFIRDNQGNTVPFSFLPVGAGGYTFDGTLILDGVTMPAVKAGAAASGTFTWPCDTFTATPPGP
jgi:hypothetical protein